jgi:hypothetical protein
MCHQQATVRLPRTGREHKAYVTVAKEVQGYMESQGKLKRAVAKLLLAFQKETPTARG